MHHPSPAVDALAAFTAFWSLLGIAVVFALGVLMPVMALVVTVNIRGIRKELSQLNETLSLPSRRI